jgi:YHS domain-containing protein
MKGSLSMQRGVVSTVVAASVFLASCSSSQPEYQCRDTSMRSPEVKSSAGPGSTLINVDAQGLALQGYDPVAYFTMSRPTPGDAKFRSTYKGATYQFASASHKTMFDADPSKYEPQFGGFCGYAASIDKVSPIGVEYWEILDGRLVLQHNQKAWDLWHKDVPGNLVKADRNWPGLSQRACR